MSAAQDEGKTQALPESDQLEERARIILERLSTAEKIRLMHGSTPFWSGLAALLQGAYGRQTWDAGIMPQHGLPGIRFADGPRGIVLEGATTFPVSMARGASWDVQLEERVGDAMGRELRALGGNLFGGVCINILHHPAWGRAQETYGEDSFLLGEMGAALTRGAQRHVMACVKHYALNSMENARFQVDVRVQPRALHEVYLPHFKRVVEEGVACVMSAYNSVNGEWAGQSPTLLKDILKTRWGFQGFVVTDFIFGLRDTKTAVNAGQDLEMPFLMHFAQHLPNLVESGAVPIERIDDAALRLIRQQLRFAPDVNGPYDPGVVACEAHRKLSLEVAQKSIVLLQNDGLLPLGNVKRLAVIGRLANQPNTGDGGSSATRPKYVVTPLEGLQKALVGQAEVLYDDASDLERVRAVARDAEAVVLVVGYTAEDEGEWVTPDGLDDLRKFYPVPQNAEETVIAQAVTQGLATRAAQTGSFAQGGDRSSLRLRPEDEALIEAVAPINPRVVVAIMAGSAVLMESWRQRAASILMLWYPGMEGGHALADVILGHVNPSAKLPFAIPCQESDLPFFDKHATHIEYDLWHGQRKLDRDGVQAAFPFGFGLSYTRFEYANLQFESEVIASDGLQRITFEVINTGSQAGDEVVQVYAAAQNSRVERAARWLVGFTRVPVEARQRRTVTLEIPASRLAYFDETIEAFVVEPLEYTLFVARHAGDMAALRGSFRVQ